MEDVLPFWYFDIRDKKQYYLHRGFGEFSLRETELLRLNRRVTPSLRFNIKTLLDAELEHGIQTFRWFFRSANIRNWPYKNPRFLPLCVKRSRRQQKYTNILNSLNQLQTFGETVHCVIPGIGYIAQIGQKKREMDTARRSKQMEVLPQMTMKNFIADRRHLLQFLMSDANIYRSLEILEDNHFFYRATNAKEKNFNKIHSYRLFFHQLNLYFDALARYDWVAIKDVLGSANMDSAIWMFRADPKINFDPVYELIFNWRKESLNMIYMLDKKQEREKGKNCKPKLGRSASVS